jgi:hypothetical protein
MRRALPSFIACLCAASLACGDGHRDTTSTGGRTATILLTDAPFPYDSIARVDVYVESIAASTSTDTLDGNFEWITLATPERVFNLLDLQNGRTAFLGEGALVPGAFRAVRMVIDVDKSSVTNVYGFETPVQWNTVGSQMAIHALVEDPLTVAEGGEIVIDFDVGRSFQGDYTGLTFIPYIRAVNTAATGSIAGAITLDPSVVPSVTLGNRTVEVYQGGAGQYESWALRATGRTDGDGHFVVPLLRPGSYIVRVDAPRNSPYGAVTRSDVVVSARQTTELQGLVLKILTADAVEVHPASAEMVFGDSLSLWATVRDVSGEWIVNPPIEWTSSNPGVATVSDYGFVRAVGAGVATITAASGTKSAGSAVVVRSP